MRSCHFRRYLERSLGSHETPILQDLPRTVRRMSSDITAQQHGRTPRSDVVSWAQSLVKSKAHLEAVRYCSTRHMPCARRTSEIDSRACPVLRGALWGFCCYSVPNRSLVFHKLWMLAQEAVNVSVVVRRLFLSQGMTEQSES